MDVIANPLCFVIVSTLRTDFYPLAESLLNVGVFFPDAFTVVVDSGWKINCGRQFWDIKVVSSGSLPNRPHTVLE